MSSQIEAAAVAVSQARANGEKTRGRFTDAQAVSDGLKARALSWKTSAPKSSQPPAAVTTIPSTRFASPWLTPILKT